VKDLLQLGIAFTGNELYVIKISGPLTLNRDKIIHRYMRGIFNQTLTTVFAAQLFIKIKTLLCNQYFMVGRRLLIKDMYQHARQKNKFFSH